VLISYHLPNLFIPGSSPEENARVLKVLLECLVAIDRIHLQEHPETPLLMDPRFGVHYGRTDEWMTIPSLYLAGYGDCKSLAAMRIAELRHQGKVAKPEFRFRQNTRGGTDYHILVRVGLNHVQDPSKECGMESDEWAHFDKRHG